MPIGPEQISQLKRFIETVDFSRSLLVLDLDGTALLEDKGKVFISSSVEKAVKTLHDLKRPVVLNTLRFPLSVIRSVGEAWYQIADVPILTVLLNGSVLGYIRRSGTGLEYEELAAFPLSESEIIAMLNGIRELVKAGIEDIILFYYSRDWRAGETIWTPKPDRIDALKAKYRSASTVAASPLDELQAKLLREEICMTSLLVDRPEDTLMAYQHSKLCSFFTHKGVDKASGIREIAARLNLSLLDSVGAGDTEMDSFLSEMGLAIIVGSARLPYRGKKDTLTVADPLELGEAISRLATMAQGISLHETTA